MLLSPIMSLSVSVVSDNDCEPIHGSVGGCSVRTCVGDRLPAAAARQRGDAQVDGQRQQGMVSCKLTRTLSYWLDIEIEHPTTFMSKQVETVIL